MEFHIHGILQARILELVAIPFSRGSSQLRDWTCVSCIGSRFFTTLPLGSPTDPQDDGVRMSRLWQVIPRSGQRPPKWAFTSYESDSMDIPPHFCRVKIQEVWTWKRASNWHPHHGLTASRREKNVSVVHRQPVCGIWLYMLGWTRTNAMTSTVLMWYHLIFTKLCKVVIPLSQIRRLGLRNMEWACPVTPLEGHHTRKNYPRGYPLLHHGTQQQLPNSNMLQKPQGARWERGFPGRPPGAILIQFGIVSWNLHFNQ